MVANLLGYATCTEILSDGEKGGIEGNSCIRHDNCEIRASTNSETNNSEYNINLECGRVEESVGGLGHIGRVETIMEGIVLDVVILEGHHEGHEGLWRYAQRFQQISPLEDCVGNAGQWSVAAQLAYPEDVDAPLIDVRQKLQIFNIGSLTNLCARKIKTFFFGKVI